MRPTPVNSVSRARLLLLVALAVGSKVSAQDNPALVLRDIPGIEASKLAPASQRELATVLTDEFDYCGRPMTLAGTLKKGDACKHTRRLVTFAAGQIEKGGSSNDVIVELGKYNQSFAGKRFTFKNDERLCQGGGEKPKVTLVEFSDFECPYCALARPLLEDFVKRHPEVRLCYAPFPLAAHPNAMVAGQAALFARDQGKFWAMHDALFENQMSLSEAFIKDLVKKLGLDTAAYAKAVAAGRYMDELNGSKDAGKQAGIESTPTLYVNGRKLLLPLSSETLALTVEDELEWLTNANAWGK
jgi:protein-disulfide isomerase